MNNLQELKPVGKLSPFAHFCCTIGNLPTSYMISLTYEEQLLWLCQYLEKTVIPAVNTNAEAVAELQNLYIQLKEYVDNYFTNLDVQEEINNKLDEMAQNGTLEEIINQEIFSELNNQISENINNIETLQENVQTINNNIEELQENTQSNTNSIELLDSQKINKLRKKYYSNYSLVDLPQVLSDNFFVKRTQLITNEKGKYDVQYNIDDFKNSGGTTYYVSPNGSNANDGLTPETPWLNLNKFTSQAQNGDTCIMLNGIYTRTQVQITLNSPCQISCNIIGESENGVWIKASDNYEFTQNSQYANVYQTNRTNCSAVTNIINRNSGILFNLTKVNTLEECSSLENSWYTDNSIVYIHLYDGIIPNNDNVALCLLLNFPNIYFADFTQNTKIYLENINCINASNGNIVVRNDTSYACNILLKNCNLYNNNADVYQYDAFSNRGAFSICDNVKAINSKKDGFNYHQGTNFEAKGIEINCVATNTGEGQSDSDRLSNNSSTGHEGAQILSVNGIYARANGGCVVDVQSAKRAMYNCKIFDSYNPTRLYDVLAQTNANIYLYDCYLKGSIGNPNLMTSGENAHIYYKNTEFDTSNGNVTELF